MIKLALRAATLVVLAGAVASCGGGAVDAKSPMNLPAKDDAPATAEAALAALDVAESSLQRALGAPGGYAQPPTASAAPMTPSPPPPPAPAQEPAAQPRGPAPTKSAALEQRHDAEAPKAAEPCSTACSALASMERAADHLCGLAGAGDNRCQTARERVKSATARVHAACPACGR